MTLLELLLLLACLVTFAVAVLAWRDNRALRRDLQRPAERQRRMRANRKARS